MRTQVTIYLPDELTERFRHQAERQGLSLSAYVTRQLATSTDQISQLQFWLNTRLDALCMRLDKLDTALGLHTNGQAG
jgi:hypothetical protein